MDAQGPIKIQFTQIITASIIANKTFYGHFTVYLFFFHVSLPSIC